MDDVTYEITLVRRKGGTIEHVIEMEGYGLLDELLDDVNDQIEKEKFDVNTER